MQHEREGGFSRGSRSGTATPSFAPPPTGATFKDLLIFEERLKQNSERLQKQRRKYEAFLVSLVCIILYLAYNVFVLPSIYSLVHYGNVATLLVSLVTLVLFFVTGMYSEKIAYAHKFVPQANRALRPFNIYLNTRTRSRFSFLTSYFRSSPPATSPASPTTTHTPPSSAPLSRRTSSSSSHSSSSARSMRAVRSVPGSPVTRSPETSPTPPPAAARGVPLAPIPPAQNPRGELIFSSRVSVTFREGYERYRGEWEKRRTESLQAQQGTAKLGWLGWMRKKRPRGAAAGGGSGSEKEREGSAESDIGAASKRDRERGRSRSLSSKPPSRQSSPWRRTQRSSTASASSSRSSSPASIKHPSKSSRSVSPYGIEPAPFPVDALVQDRRVRATSFSALLHTMDELEGTAGNSGALGSAVG